MTYHSDRFELPLRLLAAGVAVAGLGLLHSLSISGPFPERVGTVFTLVFAVCAAFIFIARGLGNGIATGLGVIIAVSIAIALGRFVGVASVATGAFMLLSSILLTMVGRIAGLPDAVAGDHSLRTTRSLLARGFTPEANTALPRAAEAPDIPPYLAVEQALGAVVSDFCSWTSTDAAQGAAAGPGCWPAFARFVRLSLQDRLSATGVQVFATQADQPHLTLVTNSSRHDGPCDIPESSPLAYARRSGHVYVNTRAPAGQLDPHQSPDSPTWRWVLPLRDTTGVVQHLVAVSEIAHPNGRRPSTAHAMRDLLELCATHVRGLRALAVAQRTDAQTGLLSRIELLDALGALDRTQHRTQEPLAILALAVEGLRRLDANRQWGERDEIVSRIGRVLQQRLHSDDVIARFTDDRFVVVMHRMEQALATATAEKLLTDIQQDVLEPLDPLGALGVAVRGGLVAECCSDSRESLLARALALLDTARVERWTLATDAGQVTGVATTATDNS